MPEPDVAVVRGSPRDLMDRHPGHADVPLLVEISVTSHAEDRAKAAPYGRAGFPEYWQLDVPGRKLVVRTEPEGDAYRTTRIVPDGESVSVNGVLVPVAGLLP